MLPPKQVLHSTEPLSQFKHSTCPCEVLQAHGAQLSPQPHNYKQQPQRIPDTAHQWPWTSGELGGKKTEPHLRSTPDNGPPL